MSSGSEFITWNDEEYEGLPYLLSSPSPPVCHPVPSGGEEAASEHLQELAGVHLQGISRMNVVVFPNSFLKKRKAKTP